MFISMQNRSEYAFLFLSLVFFVMLSGIGFWAQVQKSEMKAKYSNSLINETSPYFLQHAHNHVNWHLWGEEALNKAKSEKKIAFDCLMKNSKHLLLEARAERIRPGLDDKFLTSWNALLIKGYLDACKAIGDEAYLKKATETAEFIRDKMP